MSLGKSFFCRFLQEGNFISILISNSLMSMLILIVFGSSSVIEHKSSYFHISSSKIDNFHVYMITFFSWVMHCRT
jgi:hypothetical protein